MNTSNINDIHLDFSHYSKQNNQSKHEYSNDDIKNTAIQIIQETNPKLCNEINQKVVKLNDKIDQILSLEDLTSTRSECIAFANNYMLAEGVPNNMLLGDPATTSTKSSVSYTSSHDNGTIATTNITGLSNPSTAYTIIFVLLNMAQMVTRIVAIDNMLVESNNDYVEKMNNAYYAFNELTGLFNANMISFPMEVTANDGVTQYQVNDLFTLFQLTYATDESGNPLCQTAYDNYKSYLDPIKKELEEYYPSEMTAIEGDNWGCSDYSLPDYVITGISTYYDGTDAELFNDAFTNYENQLNTWISCVDTDGTLSQITLLPTTSHTDAYGNTFYTIDLTSSTTTNIGNISSYLNKAITAGTNVSQSLSNQQQADNQTFDQINEMISSILSMLKSIVQTLQ